jgi:hypothetical protein
MIIKCNQIKKKKNKKNKKKKKKKKKLLRKVMWAKNSKL